MVIATIQATHVFHLYTFLLDITLCMNATDWGCEVLSQQMKHLSSTTNHERLDLTTSSSLNTCQLVSVLSKVQSSV